MTCQHTPSSFAARAGGGAVGSLRNSYYRPDLIVIALVRLPIRKDTHQHDDACDEQNDLGPRLHDQSAVGLVSLRRFRGV